MSEDLFHVLGTGFSAADAYGAAGWRRRAKRGRMNMGFESDYEARLVEQMSSLLAASEQARLGAGDDMPLELTMRAIDIAVDVDPELFVELSPQSMVALVEAGSLDDSVVSALADALDLQARIFESDGSIIEAGVRHEQSQALRAAIDRSRAN